MEDTGAQLPKSAFVEDVQWPARPGVVIAASLDTKERQVAFLVEELGRRGITPIVIDCALRDGAVDIVPDIGADTVARLAGTDIATLRASRERAPALGRLLDGLGACIARLDQMGLVLGVIGIGGGTNASMAARAFSAVPYGRPKILVSTSVSGDTRPFIGGSDAVLIHSVVDFIGLGAPLRASLERAAATMQALIDIPFWSEATTRPVVGITANGATTEGAEVASAMLDGKGCETWMFHARGSGGVALERLIAEGRIAAVLDFATTEIADEVLGGLRSAGPTRLEAAGAAGVPQVIVPGGLDVVNFSELHTVPDHYANRTLIHHTPSSVLMRTSAEEYREIALWMARKLLNAKGPTTVLIPLRGFSSYDAEGRPYHDPKGAGIFADTITEALAPRPDIPVERHDLHINDARFAALACERLWAFMSQKSGKKG